MVTYIHEMIESVYFSVVVFPSIVVSRQSLIELVDFWLGNLTVGTEVVGVVLAKRRSLDGLGIGYEFAILDNMTELSRL